MPIEHIYVDKAAQKRVKTVVLNVCMAKAQAKSKKHEFNYLLMLNQIQYQFNQLIGLICKYFTLLLIKLQKYTIISIILGIILLVVSPQIFSVVLFCIGLGVMYRSAKRSAKCFDFFKLIVEILILGVIANQLIQPMFFPRISEMSVTPQYVINFGDNYELVSKHSYSIDLPLFPSTPLIGSNSLDLKLPPSRYGQEKYLLFIENNPYMHLHDFDSKDSITYNKSTDRISVNFTTDAWHVKSLNTDLYISEKTGPVRCHVGYNRPPDGTDDFWLFCNNYKLDDYVHPVGTEYYRLKIHEIRNIWDLGIKGYKFDVNDDTARVCENNIELPIDDGSVTFDLNPSDTKKLISVIRSEKEPTNERKVHNLTTNYLCYEISKIADLYY